MEKINLESIKIETMKSFDKLVEEALQIMISNPELNSIEIQEVHQKLVRCGTKEEQEALDDKKVIAIPTSKDGQDFLIVAD